MDEEDFEEILEHLRELVRKIGAEIDAAASIESSISILAKERLETYLEVVINMLKERSRENAIRINNRLEELLDIESGKGFGGVIVKLGNAEERAYSIDSYSLDEIDNFGDLIWELKEILEEIKFAPEPPSPSEGPQYE